MICLLNSKEIVNSKKVEGDDLKKRKSEYYEISLNNCKALIKLDDIIRVRLSKIKENNDKYELIIYMKNKDNFVITGPEFKSLDINYKDLVQILKLRG